MQDLGRQTVEAAWCVGQALVEIKAKKQHGEWLPWLEQEGVSHDISVRLMKLSTIQIPQLAVFDSVDAALKSLPKPESKEKKATDGPSKKEQEKIKCEEDRERLEIAEKKVEAKDAELEESKKRHHQFEFHLLLSLSVNPNSFKILSLNTTATTFCT